MSDEDSDRPEGSTESPPEGVTEEDDTEPLALEDYERLVKERPQDAVKLTRRLVLETIAKVQSSIDERE